MGRLINKIKDGSVFLNIWENEGKVKGVKENMLNFKLSRCYKPKSSDEWKWTDSFRRSDLKSIKKVIDKYLDE